MVRRGVWISSPMAEATRWREAKKDVGPEDGVVEDQWDRLAGVTWGQRRTEPGDEGEPQQMVTGAGLPSAPMLLSHLPESMPRCEQG